MSVESPKLFRFASASIAVTRLYTVLPLALLSYGLGLTVGAEAWHALPAAAAIACAVAGGYAYNDLRDQTLDRHNRPRRPIVSGRLSARAVQLLLSALFTAAFFFALWTFSWRTIAFIVLLIISACVYSDFMKQIPGLKNIFVGLWCGVLPWGASLDVIQPATALPAIVIVALFVMQKELLADVYDLEGDVAAGIRTVPAIVGPRIALGIVAMLNVASWMLVRVLDTGEFFVALRTAGEAVATINILAMIIVFLKITPITIRAYLELQKFFLIGGCLGLFTLLIAARP